MKPTSALAGELRRACARPLPALGGGDTAGRWLGLFELARREPVSLARLVEAHHDALGILAEAGLSPHPGALYGVWASEGPGAPVALDADRATLAGRKAFCSGLGLVDRALVTAVGPGGGRWLAEVALEPGASLALEPGGWGTPALAATATGAVLFSGHPVERVVGGDGWYLDRPGFWHAAVGPAACWAGAAAGLADHVEGRDRLDPHQLAARGALRAEGHLVRTLLRDAGDGTDRSFEDLVGARRRAYQVRHLVERSTARTADRFGRAFGPRPFVGDPAIAQRFADLHLYVRQEHGERDLERLGALDSGERADHGDDG